VAKFLLYVGRWQLSTPILWVVVSRLGTGIEATIIANLVGASIFFWIDKVIFRSRTQVAWEVLNDAECADCGIRGRLHRLILAPGASSTVYDRREDPNPEYRCASCRDGKLESLRSSRRISSAVQVA